MVEGWSASRTVLDAEAMRATIRRMAGEIVERNSGADGLMLVGVRTRGVPLAEALAEEIETLSGVRVPQGTLDITLYRDDLSTIAHHPVVKETRFPGSIDGQTLVLCDDVLYTGRTVRAALGALVDYGRPERVELAVLIDRGHRELPIQADFVGETVETAREELIEVHFPDTDGNEGVEVLERDA